MKVRDKCHDCRDNISKGKIKIFFKINPTGFGLYNPYKTYITLPIHPHTLLLSTLPFTLCCPLFFDPPENKALNGPCDNGWGGFDVFVGLKQYI